MGSCEVSEFVCSSSRILTAVCASRLRVFSKVKKIININQETCTSTKQTNFMHTSGPGVWGHGQGGAVSAFAIIVPLGGDVNCSTHQRLLPGQLPRPSSLRYWNV